MRALVLALALSSPLVARAQGAEVPQRQIPPEVLAGLQTLQQDFQRALEQDCAPERCFSKGCVYLSHRVVDQPAGGSLPGLRLQSPGPGAGVAPSQLYLTTAECSFTHERSVRPQDARALAKRLQAKVSMGWTEVTVKSEVLQPVSEAIRESPYEDYEDYEDFDDKPDEADAGVAAVDAAPEAPPPVTWEGPRAARELWTHLLPHFSWMIALVLGGLVALLLIWGARRLGRQSPEEQLLLAQMLSEQAGTSSANGAATPDADAANRARTEARLEQWRTRLNARDGADPALHALVADLLRTGERRLLAKAALRFPDALPKAFPVGGSLASAKFQLAEYIKTVDPATLPSDEAFLDALDRYALASSLTAHPDTDLIRSLHAEFGAAALVDLVARLPGRFGALLFALSPDGLQYEAAGLLSRNQFAQITDQLLRSNRMDAIEDQHLLDVLGALRRGEAIPPAPEAVAVSDRGHEFAATSALSILLPRLDPETRGALVGAAEGRSNGRLPGWLRTTVYGEMLLALPIDQRNDLLLQVDAQVLAAWLRAQTPQAQARLLETAPNSLRAAVASVPAPESPTAFYALVNDGRLALSAALQRLLLRGDVAFRALLA